MKNLTTIILIDDEMVLRHGLKYLCDWEASGFTIIGEAANGIEGFRLVEQLRPDIVITDIVMPGMDGVSLISKIKEHFPDIHIIVLSSYDNFSYAKSAFKLGIDDYLLKPDLEAEELLCLLRKLRQQNSACSCKSTASQFLLEQLTYSTLNDQECRREFEERGLSVVPDIPFLLLLSPGSQMLQAHKTIPAVVSSCLSLFPDAACTSCITSQGELCVLFQPYRKDIGASSPDHTALLISLTDRLHTQLGTPLSFAYQTVGLLEDLPEILLRLRETASYFFYFPDNTLLCPDDIQPSSLDFPREMFQKALKSLNPDAIQGILLDHIKAASSACLEVFSLKKQVEDALYHLIQFFNTSGFPVPEIQAGKIRYFKKIDFCRSDRELYQILDSFFLELRLSLQKCTSLYEHTLFSRIQTYINDNCGENLRLSDVAGEFHLNYTYLSTLFFQKTHEHFSDYLTRVRIEKAKRLLLSENSSIQTISEQCGFGNQGYFSKVFKKQTGYSPKEYQKKCHTFPFHPPV